MGLISNPLGALPEVLDRRGMDWLATRSAEEIEQAFKAGKIGVAARAFVFQKKGYAERNARFGAGDFTELYEDVAKMQTPECAKLPFFTGLI